MADPRAATRDRLGVVAGGTETRPLPVRGFIRFRAVRDVTIGLVAELNGPVLPVAGYATHEITQRQGREGLASYQGSDPLALSIPLLFDRDRQRGSVEPELRMLDQLLGLDGKPPRIIIEGFGVPHGNQRTPANRWELTGTPDWGDVLARPDGNRTFVPVTVTAQKIPALPGTLIEPNVGELVAVVRTFYTVPRTGHPRSLKGIAKKYKIGWRQLKKLNPTLTGDPDVGLKAGLKVRVS